MIDPTAGRRILSYIGTPDGRRVQRGRHTYPLAEAAQVHRDLEGRKTVGSIVMVP